MRLYLLALSFFPLFFVGCGDLSSEKQVTDLEIDLKRRFAPDSRTDRIDLRQQDNVLSGFTTSKAAYTELAEIAHGKEWSNEIRLLPDTAVGQNTVGIINVAVANLRSKPGHSQELATQALLGTPVQLLDFADGWYLVRTPDRYLAWLEPGAMAVMTPDEAKVWLDENIRLFVGQNGILTSEPDEGEIISTLVSGGIIRYLEGKSAPAHHYVGLPDGVAGWVPTQDIICAPQWWEPEPFSPDSVLSVAKMLAGRPYLWGGTSSNGMDCSGFTKMSYYLVGYVVPRDASQQVHAGEEVVLTDDFANLRPGDQLFFGRYREDGSEKITHTGFYLGNGRFLHAGADNGRIQENSLIPGEPDFVAHRLASLLRARRLAPGTSGVVPIREAFSSLLNS